MKETSRTSRTVAVEHIDEVARELDEKMAALVGTKGT
jgi:hypothetical protein